MRLWIDCEWNGFGGDLITMALVAEDGREWYRSLGCETPVAWVAENVMPVIGIDPVEFVDFQIDLRKWLSEFDSIHVIADWPEDIGHFSRSLITAPGYRMGTPPLTMEVVRIDAPSDQPHNALADAKGIRAAMLAAQSKEPNLDPWLPIAQAPLNTLGVAVLARMTCCGGGNGLVVMTAARQGSVWIYPGDHKFEFLAWSPLPKIPDNLPATGAGRG